MMKEVKSMKKFLVAISLVAMLGFIAVPANALVGVPDDVPGYDMLVPWIYVSMPGFGNENTLITITEIDGFVTGLHLWVNDIDSVPVHNWNETLTPFDVFGIDGLTIINSMSPLAQAALEVDTDGDGVNDHWAGYIYAFNLGANPNNLISNCYQVYLPAGMAVGFNGVSMEWYPLYIDIVRQTNFPFDIFGDETYSANALWVGKQVLQGIVPAIDATFFRLMPRYYINDAIAQSLLMIWVETAYTNIPVPGLLHCFFYDEDENFLSSNIPIMHELNIIDVGLILPAGLFPGVYPWGGWIDIQTPDQFGNGWFTDLNANGIFDGAERSWLGYSWQRAMGPAAEAWEVIQKAHRETDD
jgi:hypothetical protein